MRLCDAKTTEASLDSEAGTGRFQEPAAGDGREEGEILRSGGFPGFPSAMGDLEPLLTLPAAEDPALGGMVSQTVISDASRTFDVHRRPPSPSN
jgi:hypothetical protein